MYMRVYVYACEREGGVGLFLKFFASDRLAERNRCRMLLEMEKKVGGEEPLYTKGALGREAIWPASLLTL